MDIGVGIFLTITFLLGTFSVIDEKYIHPIKRIEVEKSYFIEQTDTANIKKYTSSYMGISFLLSSKNFNISKNTEHSFTNGLNFYLTNDSQLFYINNIVFYKNDKKVFETAQKHSPTHIFTINKYIYIINDIALKNKTYITTIDSIDKIILITNKIFRKRKKIK